MRAAKRAEFDWPEEAELVVCTVKEVKNFGGFVTLDEYESKEGFIHIAEVSSGWIKYILDYVREHQKREKIQEWKNEQKAEKLLAISAERLGITIDEVWDRFGYDLLDKFGSLYRPFEESVMDENTLSSEGFTDPWVQTFVQVAKENIVPPPDGAVHIKEALLKAVKEDGVTVKVQYIGAPRYRLVVRAPDYKTAEEEIQKAAAKVLKHLESKGGGGKFIRQE